MLRIMRVPLLTVGAVLIGLLIWPEGVVADPYRLVRGDRIAVRLAGQTQAETLQINPDGQIRLPGVGGLALDGLTLDRAEARITQAVAQAGLYVAPHVTVQMAEYAPVVVAGDVARPGPLGYLPGLTAATALGLAGGGMVQGLGPYERLTARAEAEGEMAAQALEIAAAEIRLIRLKAELSGAEMPELAKLHPPTDHRGPGGGPGEADMPSLMAAEAGILAVTRARQRTVLAQWDHEIAALEAEQSLFEQRIAVQQDIVQQLAEDLATSESLQQRRLQTASQLSGVHRRDADARARALELESARIASTRALAEARRLKAEFVAAARTEALTAQQQARQRLALARLRYDQAARRGARLRGSGLQEDAVLWLISPRPGRGGAVDGAVALLPGETLIVRSGGEADG